MSNTDAARLANRLAEDEILAKLVPQQQLLLIQAIKDVEAIKPLREVNARRLKGPGPKEHTEQEDVRAKHEH